MAYLTIEDTIGNTPLVQLQRIPGEGNARRGNVILGKLEGNNPAGSVKDRPALSMIKHAEARGRIKPGDTLIESTSGNTGIALAMAAAVRGYKMVLIMPEDLSVERRQSMAAYGAEIILTPVKGGMEYARDLADAMAQEPASSFLYTSANVGDGKVYGFEFDVSTPLSAIGLDNTGVFANYSWVKSKVDDFLGERRFNDQAKSVYNIGFIHDIPSWGASFGATYRKQGDAYTRLLAEEVLIRYGGELDVFVEKRFGTSLSVRLSANNLLDASKDEFFDKFDTLQDQIDRDYDEYELETEEAGPSYQLVMRWAF